MTTNHDNERAPLAIDLFCGTFAWSRGWLALGGRVVGFDIDHQPYHGTVPHGAQLALQDVRTLHGSQFKDAELIVASPPCQEFSYMAMPWSRSKQIARALRGDGPFPDGYTGSRTISELTALFDACFRIQREAIEAAGHHVPIVVENVRGAQPWVGRSRWAFGSFHLWGDVPALMPITSRRTDMKVGVPVTCSCGATVVIGSDNIDHGLDEFKRLHVACGSSVAVGKAEIRDRAIKNSGGSWFNVAHNTTSGHGQNPDGRKSTKGGSWFGEYAPTPDGVKQGGDWFGDPASMSLRSSSKSNARKAASAQIAKIPEPLSRWIARTYYPQHLRHESRQTAAGGNL